MPQRFFDRIVKVVSRDDYRPSSAKSLAKILKVSDEEMDIFNQAVALLADDQAISISERKTIVPPPHPKRVTGKFETTRQDFGFIRPENRTAAGDVFVPLKNAMDAANGDRVVAAVHVRGRRADGKPRYIGEIIDVLERATQQTAGTLMNRGKYWFVKPDGAKNNELITVDDPGAKNCKAGDKVQVEIVDYGDRDYFAYGVIIKKLGKTGTPSAELKSTIARFEIEENFSKKSMKDARESVSHFDPQEEIDQGRREDLRNDIIITIDPEDARDFDDAISLKQLEHGHWLLGVHIADVSTFVKEGTKLDQQAYSRGTSVYLPGHVIPMLPELLSNGLCSLQPNQDRFAKSVYIELNSTGHPVKTRFANSVIRSMQRLTYEDADRVIDGKDTSDLAPEAVDLVQKMTKLAHIINKRRYEQGMLRLDIPKSEVVLSDSGRPIDARPESSTFSHTVIEMFMLEANEAVARLFDGINVEFLRRIHPEPDTLTSGRMVQVLRDCGYDVPKSIDRFGLQQLLESIEGKPEGKIMNIAVLRSMQKAEYRPAHIGHYALASENYCHFTSPIRRYPDLMVHRLLNDYITGKLNKSTASDYPGYNDLDPMGIHCSERERNAEAAENDLKEFMLLQLLEKHIGEDLPGIVTSIVDKGIFIELDKFMVDGFLEAKVVQNYAMAQARKKGGTPKKKKNRKDRKKDRNATKAKFSESCPFRLGKSIKVRIVDVHPHARELELDIVDA